MKVKTVVLAGGRLPEYKTADASGADAYARGDTVIPAGGVRKVPLGICTEFAKTHELQVRPRSGHSMNGIVVIFGTVDADYREEIHAICHNVNDYDVTVTDCSRIAQLVLAPIERATFQSSLKLSPTSRRGGFGSTGL